MNRQVVIISDLITVYDGFTDLSYVENLEEFFTDYGSRPFDAPPYGVAYVFIEGQSNSMHEHDIQQESPIDETIMQGILDSHKTIAQNKMTRILSALKK